MYRFGFEIWAQAGAEPISVQQRYSPARGWIDLFCTSIGDRAGHFIDDKRWVRVSKVYSLAERGKLVLLLNSLELYCHYNKQDLAGRWTIATSLTHHHDVDNIIGVVCICGISHLHTWCKVNPNIPSFITVLMLLLLSCISPWTGLWAELCLLLLFSEVGVKPVRMCSCRLPHGEVR